MKYTVDLQFATGETRSFQKPIGKRDRAELPVALTWALEALRGDTEIMFAFVTSADRKEIFAVKRIITS